MGQIITIGSNKGGSGKSTTAVNLAHKLSNDYEVCLVDADKQRSIVLWYQIREKENLPLTFKCIHKLGRLTETLKKISEDYDFVIVDVAGRNSTELVTSALASDIFLAPHKCSQFDLDTFMELENQILEIKPVNPDLKVFTFQTMADVHHSHRETEKAEFLEFNSQFEEFTPFESQSYSRKVYQNSIAFGKTVLEMNNKLAKEEVESLTEELLKWL